MTGIAILRYLLIWLIAVWIGYRVLRVYLRRVVGTKQADARDLLILMSLCIGATILTFM